MALEKLAMVGAGGIALYAFLKATGANAALTVGNINPGQVSRDVDIVARTIWGEARGEGYSGMQAVANVIMNRVAHPTWWGNDPVSVCMKPYQFSAWNSNDPNSSLAVRVTTADPQFRTALEIAGKAIAGTLADITGGATHYHAKSVNPSWAGSLTRIKDIGNHVFYV